VKQVTKMELLRRRLGFTHSNLSRELGVSSGLIAQVEGRHMRCYPKLRRAISEALDISEHELFDSDNFAQLIKRKK